MTSYILRRLVFSVFVIFAAVTVIFIVIRAIPGNPAETLLGVNATHAEIVALTKRLGLDDSEIVQYGKFLWGVLHLNFGNSIQFGTPALTLVGSRIGASAELAGVSMGGVLVVAFVVGPLLARVSGRRVDRGATSMLMFIQALPPFWVGLLLLLVFVDHLDLLPPGGYSGATSFIMPAIALGFPFACVLARLVRSGLLEVMDSPYIQTARAKGLSDFRVLWKHSLRNMLIPVVTVGGVQLGLLFAGAAVIETVFNWPGVGQLLINAINYRDYTVVEGCVFVFACVFVALNFLVDVLYAYIDPRVRVAGRP
ncbi:MAG: ABC transporter permease [Actinomycetota bacterium]|jgi:ABC-type dipeptide/oligopeptide/nickel transport system permease component|nr:ABC transporter permease [Actinomycetota bacterium]